MTRRPTKGPLKWVFASLTLALCLCFFGAPPARAAVLTLPQGMKAIGEEAFQGDSGITEAVLPEGLESIGSKAFADSGLLWIKIPDSVTDIAPDAFENAGSGKTLIISASANSAAAQYAAAKADGNIRCWVGAVTVACQWKQLAVGVEFDLMPTVFPSGEAISFQSETTSATVDAGGHVKIVDEGRVEISFTDQAGKHLLISQDVLPVFYFPQADDTDQRFLYRGETVQREWRCEALGGNGEGEPFPGDSAALPDDRRGRLTINAVEAGAWSASVTEGQDWIHLKKQSGTDTSVDVSAIITLDENPDFTDRAGCIRFTLGKYTYDYAVTQSGREHIPVSSVTLSETSKTLKKGGAFTLTATVSPASADDPSVTWASSNPTVAMVTNGRVVAMNTGSAVINVTTNDGGKTAACTVTVKDPNGLPDDDSLCLVCLGYQLNPDGSMQLELQQRLETLKRLALQYPNAIIVCTGGSTASGAPYTTEAGQMAKWLRNNGLASRKILTETSSLSTEENARNTIQILSRRNPKVTHVLLVTSEYHMSTALQYFRYYANQLAKWITVTGNNSR